MGNDEWKHLLCRCRSADVSHLRVFSFRKAPRTGIDGTNVLPVAVRRVATLGSSGGAHLGQPAVSSRTGLSDLESQGRYVQVEIWQWPLRDAIIGHGVEEHVNAQYEVY